MSQSPRSVVVISTHVALLERMVANAGFTVVGAADVLVNGERLVELFEPSFLIIDFDLPGEHDLAAVERLRQQAPHTRIVLVVSHQYWAPDETSALGVAAVLLRDDLLELGALLLDLEASAPPVGDRLERRSGRDRRIVQDWSKVGWEYRTAVRRADDRAEPETVSA